MKRKNSGITLIALVITIIVLLILAGVALSLVAGSDGLLAKAEKAVSETEKAAMQEDAELAIATIKMDYYEDYATNKTKTAKEFIVAKLQAGPYKTARGATMKADADGNITYTLEGVSTKLTIDENGKVTLGESSGATGEESVGENYYGDALVVPTDQKYFTFTINEDGQTATITGIKDEYAELSYYKVGETVYNDSSIKCVINDNGNYITEVAIPYEYVDENNNKYVVTSIGDYAFGPESANDWGGNDVGGYEEKESMFTSFKIPNCVTNIGKLAFAGNVKLTQINIPKGVTILQSRVFNGCRSLNSIDIANVTTIGDGVFWGCTSLSSITMPKVTSIGILAFHSCRSLENVSMPIVIEIQDNAFGLCPSLSSIEIPSTVTTIVSSFQYTENLTTVTIDSPTVASGLTRQSSCGYVINKATTVYVKSGLTVGSYVTSNFTEGTSDKDGYVKYTKN